VRNPAARAGGCPQHPYRGAFTTYAIEAPRGSRTIAVNGAAARLVRIGDKVIIVAYCQIPAEEARNYRPSVVVLGEGNAVERAA
jgi:aspartate 1-decarboxylase